jgi:2-amino-4-hydroxy-6-hydroxymethyldihydropteridine diphosphokinase
VEGDVAGLRVGYLGLGSNVGDRLRNMRAARDTLVLYEVAVEAASSVYETAPQGEVTDQPDFLNAVLRIRTALGPEEGVERDLGREPGGVRHGPRPIDVDVLLLGDLEYSSDRLSLPHREVTSRRFVLEPLLELDPGLELPNGTPLAEARDAVAEQPVSRVAEL